MESHRIHTSIGRSGEIGMLYRVKTSAPKIVTHSPMILDVLILSTYVRTTRIATPTSTCQPSFFMYSQSSREVLTLLLSTAVHVGRMAPSPSSIAKEISQMRRMTYMTANSLPISLCVKMRLPNLHSRDTYMAHINGTRETTTRTWSPRQGCHS